MNKFGNKGMEKIQKAEVEAMATIDAYKKLNRLNQASYKTICTITNSVFRRFGLESEIPQNCKHF